MTVHDIRAQLASQVAGPVITEGMTYDESEAEMRRWLDDCQVQSKRLDEEHMLLGIGRSAAIYMTHEITGSWLSATAGRWYLALPERYMTPDDMTRPDWDHSHYEHDEHGHIGRVATRERPATQEDTRQELLVASILAELQAEQKAGTP
jgi:hypothetical protein